MTNLNFDEILQFQNSKEFIELNKYYNSVSTLELFNYYGQENPHTNFLANLFKITNPYTNNADIFKKFLGLISIKAQKGKISKYEIFMAAFLNSFEIMDLEVISQKPLKSKKPDITIQFSINNQKYLIILEAKINAEENEYEYNGKKIKQTLLYRQLVEEEYGNDYNKYYVFLSNKDNPKIFDEGNWIKINYQELVDYVLFPCSLEVLNTQVPLTLDEYIKSYSNSYGRENIGNLRLAITPKEKELVESVWTKYEKVIRAIMDNIVKTDKKSNLEITDDEKLIDIFYENKKPMFSFIYDALFKMNLINEKEINELKTKKTIHYFYDSSYNNVDLFYEVIKDIIEEEKINNIEQLHDIVNIGIEKLLIDDIEEIPSKYREIYRKKKENQNYILINDKECFYITWISREMIEKFISNVKKKYPRYKDILG